MEGSKCPGQEVAGTESSANQVSPEVSGEFLEAVTVEAVALHDHLCTADNHFVSIQALGQWA